MRNRNVLVTGGAGFIGSHLVDALVMKGANVVVLDDLSAGLKSNLNRKARFVKGDINDIKTVRNCLQDVELIYHLAADATTRESSMGWDNPTRTLQVNALGTLNVFKSALDLDLNARIIYASSAAVYGKPLFIPVNEEHPTNPVSPYGISKLTGEKIAFASFREFGVDSISVRIFNTYGPRQPRYVIFDLITKLQADRTRLEVMGTPNVVRDYCYVSDMVDALVLVAQRGVAGMVYNVSGDNPITIGRLVKLMLTELDLVGRTRVHYTGKSWKGDIEKMAADITAIKRLGFRPNVKLEEGIRMMLESQPALRDG